MEFAQAIWDSLQAQVWFQSLDKVLSQASPEALGITLVLVMVVVGLILVISLR